MTTTDKFIHFSQETKMRWEILLFPHLIINTLQVNLSRYSYLEFKNKDIIFNKQHKFKFIFIFCSEHINLIGQLYNSDT